MFKGYNSQPTGFGTILVVFYLMCQHIKPTICSNKFEVVMAMKQIYSLNDKLIGFRYFRVILGMTVHEERLFVFNSRIIFTPNHQLKLNVHPG